MSRRIVDRNAATPPEAGERTTKGALLAAAERTGAVVAQLGSEAPPPKKYIASAPSSCTVARSLVSSC
jgi:hypothetical protein